jgi:hypothetical protein
VETSRVRTASFPLAERKLTLVLKGILERAFGASQAKINIPFKNLLFRICPPLDEQYDEHDFKGQELIGKGSNIYNNLRVRFKRDKFIELKRLIEKMNVHCLFCKEVIPINEEV